MLGILFLCSRIHRDLRCLVFGHRVRWGKTYCNRCERSIDGDELAP